MPFPGEYLGPHHTPRRYCVSSLDPWEQSRDTSALHQSVNVCADSFLEVTLFWETIPNFSEVFYPAGRKGEKELFKASQTFEPAPKIFCPLFAVKIVTLKLLNVFTELA